VPGRRLFGDCVAQTSEIYQRGLAENVVADDTRRVPGEVQVASTIDDLP
jgi:hypothetical protein